MTRTRFLTHGTRWRRALLGVLVVIGLGVLLSWEQRRHREQTHVYAAEGAPALAFTLPSQTGDRVALASYLGRQPVVLAFYMGEF